MRSPALAILLSCLFVSTGCDYGPEPAEHLDVAAGAAHSLTVVDQIVDASCGQCQFAMEGTGCDLAVRLDGQAYYVDGSSIDDHGDAHGDDGMCDHIRQAKVKGEITDGRFVASSFELMPAGDIGE